MKKGLIYAGLIILLGILITPLMMILAFRERGGWGVGGEFAPLVLCIVIAFIIIDHYRRKEDTTCETPKQSKSPSEKE